MVCCNILGWQKIYSAGFIVYSDGSYQSLPITVGFVANMSAAMHSYHVLPRHAMPPMRRAYVRTKGIALIWMRACSNHVVYQMRCVSEYIYS